MPEQYLTPPPPHALLTAESSFYARSGLFFLFLVSLIFALVACNGGGGGSSSSKMQDPSSDDDNGSSDDLNIVFSPFDNTADTVIGMREFLLTVTYKDLAAGAKESLVFIVGESATPPAWTAVENHPAKITRSFDNADKQTREIYFSLTEQYQSLSNVLIDLGTGDDKTLTSTNAPGIMTPNTAYYVHVYAGEEHAKTSAAIITLSFPDSFPPPISKTDYENQNFLSDPYSDNTNFQIGPYLWAMDGWRQQNAGLRAIELRGDENVYMPIRVVQIISEEAARTACNLSPWLRHRFQITELSQKNYVLSTVSFPQIQASDLPNLGGVAFTAATASNYYDIMIAIPKGHSSFSSDLTQDCAPNIINRDAIRWSVTVVAE